MGVEDILGSSRKVEDVGDDHFWTDLRVEFYYVVIILRQCLGKKKLNLSFFILDWIKM